MPKAFLREKPVWLRLLVALLIGIVVTVLLNILWSSNSSARADEGDGSRFAGQRASGSIDLNTGFCEHAKGPGCRNIVDAVTSPDARQAIGNASVSCIAGLVVAGGPLGCAGAALGSALTSIPFDGTWD